MRRLVASIIVAFVVGVIVGNANAIQAQAASGVIPPASSCAMYDPALNIAAWYNEGGNSQVAIFIDKGDDAFWMRNQERVPNNTIPNRVRLIVTHWPVHSSALRVACIDRAWVNAIKKGMIVCGRMIARGDAYTREMYDACIGDYADMRMSKGA